MSNIEIINQQANKTETKRENKNEFLEIENTPFTAVKVENKYILVMGDVMVSGKRFDEIEDVMAYINNKPWELILVAAKTFADKLNEIKKEKK